MQTILTNQAFIAIASLIAVAVVSASIFLAVFAIAVRRTEGIQKRKPVIIYGYMPSQLPPLHMHPLPVEKAKGKPKKLNAKKQAAKKGKKQKALIKPMYLARVTAAQPQKLYFK